MPRMFAVNHHPEIVDRFRQVMILDQKRDRGEVSEAWYRERLEILTRPFPEEDVDQRLHLTSDFTLLGPLRFHLFRAGAQARARRSAAAAAFHEDRVLHAAARRAGRARAARPRCSEARAMIPKPPFLKDLTPEQEIAEFQRLKPRLAEVWDALTMREEEPHTAVVVPSLTLDQSELRKISGASFYEERLLFLLIRLRNPRARMVYVTSQPIHPIILEYYLQFLAGIPASHARSRLTLLCADDASPRSLTEKILERPRLIERIRAGIMDPSAGVPDGLQLDAARAQARGAARRPAQRLRPAARPPRARSRAAARCSARPGCDAAGGLRGPAHAPRRRGGARRAARRGGRAIRRAVRQARRELLRRGQRALPLPRVATRRRRSREALRQVEFSVASETPEAYFDKFAKMGGIVEEFIEAEEKHSPSAQLRVGPRGDVLPISTHDQILGGPSGQVFLGCRFPARDDYRMRDPGGGRRGSAHVLAAHGVVSRFGVDFLVYRDAPGRRLEARRRSRSTCAWAAPPTPTWRCSS